VKRLLIFLLLVFVLPVTLLLGMAGSEPGTRLIFRLAQELYPPLKVRATTGTLLGTLVIHDLSYHSDDFSLTMARVRFVWRPSALGRRTIMVDHLELDRSRIEWSATKKESGPTTLPGITLPLRIELKSLDVRGLEIAPPDVDTVEIDRVILSASMKGDRLDLHHLELTMAELEAKGSGAVTLQRNWPITASIEWRYRTDPLWHGTGRVSGDLQELTLDHRLNAPFDVTTSGKLSRLLDAPVFDIKGSWQQIGWPLKNHPQWLSRQGRYRIHGWVDTYQLELATEVSGTQLPTTRLKLTGKGDETGILLRPLTAEGPVGHLKVEGRVRWSPQLVWDLTLKGRDLDPAPLQPDWPGKLTLEARTRGRLQSDLSVELELKRLKGELRAHPLQASGRFHYQGDILRARGFNLVWAGNRLQLDGRGTTQQLDLEFDLQAPHLERLDPELKGELSGQGRISGSPKQPKVDLHLLGRNFAWGDELNIQRLDFKAKGNPDDPASHLRLELYHLKIAGWRFNHAALSGDGQPADHRIGFSAEGPLGKIMIHLQGGYLSADRSHWQGEVQHLPLALMRPLLPQEVSASGDLHARFSYHQEPQRREGELVWRFKDASFSTRTPDGQTLSLPLAQGGGNLVLQDRILRLSFELPLADYGRIEARLTTELESRSLSGFGKVEVSSLELLQVFVPQLQKVKGSAHGEIHLTGSWNQPKVQGKLAIQNAGMEIPVAGLELQEIQLQAASRPDGSLVFGGRVHSGPGSIQVQGRMDLVPEFSIQLQLKGQQFLAANLPEARVLISPELRMIAKAEMIEVQGKVHVPEAKINLKTSLLPDQQPGIVSVSADEIIIGRPAEPKQSKINLSANILVTLGKEVYFNGYGVESQLRGELRLSSWQQVPKAEGVIEVVKGKFAAYGQKLEIKSGRIIFSGPVDNPGLDIEVARVFRREQITIFLKIGGSTQEPVITITSDPSMPEDEALSYLITGRSFRNKPSGATTGSMEKQLSGALGSLGVNYLNDLGLSDYAEVELEEGVVLLGRYLTPDLYLGFAVDVFDGLGEAVIRYRLTKYLSLEGRYGESQSGDIFYTLETD